MIVRDVSPILYLRATTSKKGRKVHRTWRKNFVLAAIQYWSTSQTATSGGK